LDAVQKRFGGTRVLDRVDLEIADGEYVVLLGRSGCGKSTLLRCIAGLEEVSEGRVFIGDRDVTDVSPRDRDVAMVFQSYALYPHMTVAQNLAFALEIRSRPRAEIDKAVREAADLLDIAHLLDRLPAHLSGGQRQRVAMGRAIVRRPAVFLFDEPLSNLDAALRHHMRLELKRLHRQLGGTFVHVTHDQIEAMTLGDRLVLLDGGVVQQVGTPRDVYEAPANVFVAKFIGAPQMNLWAAHGHGDTSRVEGVDAVIPVPGDGKYTLGVRPNDIELAAGGPLRAKVELVEALGDEAFVHLVWGGQRAVVRVDPTTRHEPGADVDLAFRRVHRFDATSGLRLPS
jgi:multiple sugar transport system ATP-binding protein